MSADCCSGSCSQTALRSARYRRVLIAALLLNAAMFVVEIVAGASAGSLALFADAIDFFGDAANYAISLAVLSMALLWRARAALLKGLTMAAFGAFILVKAFWLGIAGGTPEPFTMGIVAILALLVNGGVALLLYAFREGDANMRSVWLCSRNDAIGNIAVFAAALGVFGTGTRWPDLLVALVMGGLALSGGWSVIRQARGELREVAVP